MKKLFAILLAVCMVLSMTTMAMAEDTLVIMPNPLTSPAAVIYFTNDVHTYLDKDNNYAKLATLLASTPNAMLVDAGDHIQGTAYGGMDQGHSIINIMNTVGYGAATLGNHEFDYGMAGAMWAIDNAEYPYISCNFTQDIDQDGVWETVLDAYKVFEIGGLKVAFVGVTTPETFTKSTPAYFQNEAGEYIYGIDANEKMYADVQAAIDAARAEADVVIGLGHLGIDPSSEGNTSRDVIANTYGLSAFIDGHSHNAVASELVADKYGTNVVLTQTGNYMDNVGKLTIAKNLTITTELIQVSDLEEDADVKAVNDAWMTSVDDMLGATIAESDINFTINDAEGKRAIRKYATNMGDYNADAYYWYINSVAGLDCDVAIMNGGGIRANVDAGEWTYKTAKTVNPFGNVLCLMEVPGQMILDALEFGSRLTTEVENGGFLHVAGLTYQVDYGIENTVPVDEKNVWQGAPTGGYRVYNVRVYNKETDNYEPLSLTKTYTLGGANYTLRQQGDGFNMFQEAAGMKLIMEGISEDYLANAAYAAAFTDTDGDGIANIASANSPLLAEGIVGENYLMDYETATGSGRINVAVSTDIEQPVIAPAPVEEEEPVVAPAATGYTVVAGDYLRKIAKKLLGDEAKWTEIYNANKSIIKNPDLIYAGQVLLIG